MMRLTAVSTVYTCRDGGHGHESHVFDVPVFGEEDLVLEWERECPFCAAEKKEREERRQANLDQWWEDHPEFRGAKVVEVAAESGELAAVVLETANGETVRVVAKQGDADWLTQGLAIEPVE